jgi:hypothetical protein
VGDASVLSHCSLVRSFIDQNRPVCWSIVVKKKPIVGYPFFWSFSSDRTSKATKDSMYTSLFTVAIPVNYTS